MTTTTDSSLHPAPSTRATDPHPDPTLANREAAVSPAELAAMLAEHADVRILDVRTPGEFESEHIAGAYNIPLVELPGALDELYDVSSRLVVVCQSGSRADSACATLQRAGVGGAELLAGGMAAWKNAGGHVRRRARHRWELERQVRLTAGALVLTSIAVSVSRPAARFVAGLVGGGLVFAAISNTCAMGTLLSKLPYNRPRHASSDPLTVARHLRAGTTPPSSHSPADATRTSARSPEVSR